MNWGCPCSQRNGRPEVRYKNTYFRNPKTGNRCYLLDRLMGSAAGERLTEDAVARICEEATDSSYQKGAMKHTFMPKLVYEGIRAEEVFNRIIGVTQSESKKYQLYLCGQDEFKIAWMVKDGSGQNGAPESM